MAGTTRQMKGGWVAEVEPLNGKANGKVVDELAIPEIGAMMLLRARQFKNNPHSGLRAGDVFVTKLDTKGGTWSCGETGFDVDTAEACIVVTHEENDFQAKAAQYELDKVAKAFAATTQAIQRCNRENLDIPEEWSKVYKEQKTEMERLQSVVDARVVNRWKFKNTDPLPPMRVV